jgi:tetratricopeptide (TPR) repeat protein
MKATARKEIEAASLEPESQPVDDDDIRWLISVRVARLIKADRRDEALALCNQAIEEDPNADVVARAYATRAIMVLDAGGPAADALADCNRAFEFARLDPSEPVLGAIFGVRAKAFVKLGQIDDAKEDIALALALTPDGVKLKDDIRAFAEIIKARYTGEAPASRSDDASQNGMREDFNIQIKQARTEVLASMLDLDNPALSDAERLTRARRIKASFERRRAEDRDYPASPEVQKAISIINRQNYQNAKARKAKAKLAM